jgi:putative sigma-54 modulation protein
MEIVVRGRNVSVTERMQEYVEKKVGKLERYLPIIDEARMELSQEETRSAQHRMIAQLTVRSRGKVLRAEERDQDLFAAIDLVAEKMQRQITRFKDRLYSRGQVRGAETVRVSEAAEAVAEAEVEAVAEAEVEPVGSIVRTKTFPVTPMNPEEAIEQMELLGHDFFVFYNSDVDGINVLYRRRSGDYGLLQPELA